MRYYMLEYFQNFNHLIKIYIQCTIQNSQTSEQFCCLLYISWTKKNTNKNIGISWVLYSGTYTTSILKILTVYSNSHFHLSYLLTYSLSCLLRKPQLPRRGLRLMAKPPHVSLNCHCPIPIPRIIQLGWQLLLQSTNQQLGHHSHPLGSKSVCPKKYLQPDQSLRTRCFWQLRYLQITAILSLVYP